MGQESGLNDSWVVLGRIGAPFGVRGWVHIQSFTHPPENILNYQEWCLCIKSHWQTTPVTVHAIRAQGRAFVALLQGYDTREAAAQLTQAEIGVSRAK